MRKTLRIAAPLLLFVMVFGCGSRRIAPVTKPAGIVLDIRLDGGTDGTFKVSGFSPSLSKHLAAMDISSEWWADVLKMRVEGKGGVSVNPLLGDYSFAADTLSFKPRFPLQRGLNYWAVVDVRHIPCDEGEFYEPASQVFLLEKPQAPPTTVTQVYPTRDALPENLLRFYFHFSAPMSRGDVYQYIRLLDAAGKPVEAPFLELEQELWDESSRRFTLLIDPGRIKRGLKPREDVGPALEQGKNYTLVIDRAWPDANGEPLTETYRKPFRVVAPDETQPDPKNWQVQAPAAATAEPLSVRFPKPLDHGMLERVLRVTDEAGREVEGTITVTDEETRWRFTPKGPWRAGAYSLVIDTTLEDPAGNSIARPFEVDVFRPIERKVETKTVKVAFTVK